MTDASPLPPALEAAEDELRHQLHAFDQAARAAYTDLHERLEARAFIPLREAVAEAAARHHALLEQHGFDRPPDAPPRPPGVLWDALTAYRRDAAAVYETLRERLAELDLGATTGEVYQTMLRTAEEATTSAPDVLVRPEPEGLVAAEAGDSAALLARKAAERARRRAEAAQRSLTNGARRLVRREPRPTPPRTQSVPLRALLNEHVRLRLPRLLAAEHRRTQRHLSEAVAALERALTDWANELVRLESAVDLPQFHAPSIFDAPDRRPTPRTSPSTAHAEENEPDDDFSSDETTASEDQPNTTPAGSDTGEDPEASEQGVAPDEVRRARVLAQALDATLQTFSPSLPPASSDLLDGAAESLGERVRRSGFDSDLPAQPGDREPVAELHNAVERWTEWHRSVGRRLRVGSLLFTLRERLLVEVEHLIETVADSVIRPIQSAVGEATIALADLRAEAIRACDRNDAPAPLADAVRGLLRRAVDHVDGTLLPALQAVSLDRAVQDATSTLRTHTDAVIADLPERVVLHAAGADLNRLGDRTAVVDLRRIVSHALDEAFHTQIAHSADGLRQPLFNALSNAERVRDIIRYNLEAALEELEATDREEPSDAPPTSPEASADVSEGSPDEDLAESDVLAEARELVVDGLARAEDQLHGVVDPLDTPWRAFVQDATETFESGWTTLYGRSNAANLIEAQFLDVRTRAQRAFRSALATTQSGFRRLSHLSRVGLRFGRRGARRLVQLGQAAAGLTEQTEADRQRTLDALAEAHRLHAGLPLVYRRLFSFAPITDPTLQESRSVPLQRVVTLAERWQEARDSSSIVVTAEPGGGRTSFINVLRAVALDGADVAEVRFTTRLDRVEDVARLLGEALGVEVDSLEALEAAILDASSSVPRRPCIVEGLEHLLLRAPDGLDLIERVLIFMSRTDARVLWIGTMVQPGWRFIERVAPQITGLVTSVTLPPFTRMQVESALMRRHARSGLPLTFAEPETPSPLLARRLGKATTPEERQAVLRTEFFDGLYRASGPNLRLALFYWLRAADFEAAADTLTLHPVRPLDFSFLAQFDLPRSFALKALLQHGSLTLAEHDRIFRTTRDESFLIFESLHNLRLIRPHVDLPATPNGQKAAPLLGAQPVREDVRYQLHPLAVAPVAAALRAKNIL